MSKKRRTFPAHAGGRRGRQPRWLLLAWFHLELVPEMRCWQCHQRPGVVLFDDYQPRPRIEELVRMPLEHALDQLLADVLADQLAKSINDAAWGQFLSWLRSYGAIANVPVVAVSPKFTTQDCFGCGERVKKSLSVRTHVCPQCGLVLDRDENAALNILSATLDSPLSTPYRRAGGNGSLFRAAQRFWTEDR